MDVVMPHGCGNAPRVHIVADFATRWASGSETLGDMLAADCEWYVDGRLTEVPSALGAPEDARLELRSIITHGREAACEGTVGAVGEAVEWCHIIRFTGAASSAKIAQVRTYMSPRLPTENAG